MPEMVWQATSAPDVVKIPERCALADDGKGPPGGPEFERALAAVYGLTYTLKFARKARGKESGLDRSRRDGGRTARRSPRREADLALATAHGGASRRHRCRARASDHRGDVEKRGKLVGLKEVAHVYVEHVSAQRVGRALHVGPYGDVPRTLGAIDHAVVAGKLAPGSSYVEIYLKDPRRTKPEKLETVLLRELG